ncbi:MAG: hypothetical protein J2P25_12605 [Nocardiopsaceae bacterium]|nr:hypothetical protein [Nocardiopsaceae bacterium]
MFPAVCMGATCVVAGYWNRAEHEAGTVVYAVHTVEGKPLERIFYELYRDKAAFDAHEEQEHTRRFLDARGQFLASVDVDRLTLQAGKGTDG